MIRTAFFYISVNLLHYVTSYDASQVKKRFLERERKEGYEGYSKSWLLFTVEFQELLEIF